MKLIAIAMAMIGFANAQSQTGAAPRIGFDVASVRQNKSDAMPVSNFPPGPEDTSVGGLFSASGSTLYQYISLAYDFTIFDYQLLKSRLPQWVFTDRFDIQARAGGNPTKAQIRLMMQSLLADRFKLAMHFETREVPEFALVRRSREPQGRNSTRIRTAHRARPHLRAAVLIPRPTHPANLRSAPET